MPGVSRMEAPDGQRRVIALGFSRIAPVPLLLIVLAMTGCGSIGPKTVIKDRFDYTGAVGDS